MPRRKYRKNIFYQDKEATAIGIIFAIPFLVFAYLVSFTDQFFLMVIGGVVLAVSINLFFSHRKAKRSEAMQRASENRPVRKPSELFSIELEDLAYRVYSKLGYRNVTHTGQKSSTDGGVDVWMLNSEGFVEIVQCKQMSTRITRSMLVDFAHTMRQQHAVKGHYWAPGEFSGPAIDYARQNNIQLYESPAILNLIEQVYPAPMLVETKEIVHAHKGANLTQLESITIPNRKVGILILLSSIATGLIVITTLLWSRVINFESELPPIPTIPTLAIRPTATSPVGGIDNTAITETESIIWESVTVLLFNLTFQLPNGWEVLEERWPEPTGPTQPERGHDCAKYTISSPDGSQILTLSPTCGFWESIGYPCPRDIVSVRATDSDNQWVRFYSEEVSAYVISGAGIAQYSDGTQELKPTLLCQGPAAIAIRNNDDLIFIEAVYSFHGDFSRIDEGLSNFDKIMQSLEPIQ